MQSLKSHFRNNSCRSLLLKSVEIRLFHCNWMAESKEFVKCTRHKFIKKNNNDQGGKPMETNGKCLCNVFLSKTIYYHTMYLSPPGFMHTRYIWYRVLTPSTDSTGIPFRGSRSSQYHFMWYWCGLLGVMTIYLSFMFLTLPSRIETFRNLIYKL